MNMSKITNVAIIILLMLSNGAMARTAHLNNCNGTELSYKSARKACKSGNYPGETVVTCNRKGEQKDRRICSSDAEKKGVYIGNCAGAATGYTNLKKACQSGNYFGVLLVRCRYGEEKNRMQCESAEEDDDRVIIFKNKCGSNETIEGRNLRRACRNNPGEILVKCRKKRNIWKEKKSMFCQGKKDRFKLKKCSSNEREIIISDYELAEDRVDLVLSELENELQTNQDMDKKLRNKMEVVRDKLEKIQTAMDRPRTYVCRANKNRCSRANAHTMFTGHKVKICDTYFSKLSALERASILVHEISHHKTHTNDKGTEHSGCVNPNLSRAANSFHKQAEYYEHIIECGLYIPN